MDEEEKVKSVTKKVLDGTYVKRLPHIVYAVIALVLGILFCCSRVVATEVISIVFGTVFVVLGVLSLCAALFKDRNALTGNSVMAGILVTVGAVFMIQNIMEWITTLIPYFIVLVGVLLMIDAFLLHFCRNKADVKGMVVRLVAGAVLFAFGLVMILVDAVKDFIGVIFGVILIVLALYEIITFILNKTTKKILADDEAEPTDAKVEVEVEEKDKKKK